MLVVDKISKSSAGEKQVIKLVAKRISNLPKDKWNELPKTERKEYLKMAHRALAGLQSFEKRKAAKLEHAASQA